MINKAPQDNSITASVMKQSADLGVFRFLDLPRELRDKIYGNLLIHDKPIQLERSKLFEVGKRCRYYETRLGLAPQICRTNKKVALESFAVLYGENTFHSTGDNSFHPVYCDLGLDMYSHLVKSIQIDVFRPGFTLSMQSENWVFCDPFTQFFDNLKKLRFNLPQELQLLTESNKDALLNAKRFTPKCATVEFCGANQDISLRLVTTWSKHVPVEMLYPEREPRPFNPLEWSKKQVYEEESKQLLSPPVSTRHAQTSAVKRPSPGGCSVEASQLKKKQRLYGDTPCNYLGPFNGSLERIERDGLESNTETRLRASTGSGLAEEKGTFSSRKKSIAKEISALERKTLAIEKELLGLEKKKLALENERIALGKKMLAMEEAENPPSPASAVSI
ncbi:hypothetical protein V492_07125 [Pseudogymnoascus sp. VKM F-4246]|nr:hypothetical protein V492_07125 [Pseudogymnoascus sp. VKM F-4246]